MIIVHISKDGSMDEPGLTSSNQLASQLTSLSKSQGEGSIKLLYEWIHNSSKILCYGWYDGDAGFENKHELPPSGTSKFLEEDSSTILLFGDIFLCRKSLSPDIFIDFDIPGCGDFYSSVVGGFDDCDDDYSDSDLDHSAADDDFIDFIDDDDDEGDDDEGDDGDDGEGEGTTYLPSDESDISGDSMDYSEDDLSEDDYDYKSE